jgi:hypothetical protein
LAFCKINSTKITILFQPLSYVTNIEGVGGYKNESRFRQNKIAAHKDITAGKINSKSFTTSH